MDAGVIKQELANKAESVCKLLLPAGKRRGSEWCVGSTDGEEGHSLKVHLNGGKAGVWCDFAAGTGGDLLDLYCAVNGTQIGDALKWAKEYLGMVDIQFHQIKPAKEYRRPVVKNVRTPHNGTVEYLTQMRALLPDTIKTFQLGEQAERRFQINDGASHTCPAVVFPFKVDGDLRFIKYLGIERPEGKKLTTVEAGCEPVLFGWHALPPNQRTVIICEGEFNSMSWHQYGFHALATPYGAGKGAKHNWITSDWERLEQFETIYLNFDPDKPGQEAVADLVDRLGRHRCLIVPPMPDGLKDINDCLVAGIAKEIIQSLLDASKGDDPKELRSATEFTDDVIERFYPSEEAHQGVRMPFEGFGDKFAFRRGELTVMTGSRGHGKSQALNWIHAKAMERGERVCIASFEMPAPVLLYRLVRQLTGQRTPSTEYIRRAMTWLADRLWIYDHVGTVDRKRALEVFEYAHRRYGVTYFVLDSLMKCKIGGDDYNAQDDFTDDLDSFCQQKGVHTTLVAHARKGDEKIVATNNEVKGSGGITDKAWNVISIWRNKGKEIAMQKSMTGEELNREDQKALEGPDCVWYVDKQREGDGWIGQISLGFDPDSQQFLSQGTGVTPIVPFDWQERLNQRYEAEQEIVY